jgi:hypothetical protein
MRSRRASDYTDMIYAATRQEIEGRRKACPQHKEQAECRRNLIHNPFMN